MGDDESLQWIRTDNTSDLLNCLEQCFDSYQRTREDLRHWKWCAFAAHGAAQIAMVIALTSEGEDKHLSSKSRKELWKYLEGTRDNPLMPMPDTKLNAFMSLYDEIRPLLPSGVATPELHRNVRRLNSLRNGWMHFGEDNLSVHVGLARMAVQAGIDLVVHLDLTSPEYLYSTPAEAQRHNKVMEGLLSVGSVAGDQSSEQGNSATEGVIGRRGERPSS